MSNLSARAAQIHEMYAGGFVCRQASGKCVLVCNSACGLLAKKYEICLEILTTLTTSLWHLTLKVQSSTWRINGKPCYCTTPSTK